MHSCLTEALALVGGTVYIDLGTDYIAKWHEHLSELSVSKLLGQVVDEEVAAFRTCGRDEQGAWCGVHIKAASDTRLSIAAWPPTGTAQRRHQTHSMDTRLRTDKTRGKHAARSAAKTKYDQLATA